MAAFKALASTLLRNRGSGSRFHVQAYAAPFLSHLHTLFCNSPSSPSLAVSPNPLFFVLRLTSSRSRLFSPIGGGWVPFSGPLFLSAPAWKLSQSATPLYLRGKEAVFPTDLVGPRRFPIDLGLRSVGKVGGAVGDVIGRRHKPRDDGKVEQLVVEEKFLNLPNLISISRMVSGPVIGWEDSRTRVCYKFTFRSVNKLYDNICLKTRRFFRMIISEWYFPAFCALAVSGATDWLDGYVARKMKIDSVFGSYLDPLADKVLIGCVALSMVKADLLHPGLVGLVLFRDVALVSGAVYKRASSLGWEWKSWSDFVNLDRIHRVKVEPLFISKVNTVLQLLLVAFALLQPVFGTEETQTYITYLSWLVASTTAASSVAYGVQHLHSKGIYVAAK